MCRVFVGLNMAVFLRAQIAVLCESGNLAQNGDFEEGAAGASAGRSFYVSPDGDDSASGTKDSPWKTVAAASKRLKPGDTLHVLPGIYHEMLDNGDIPSGVEGHPITFLAEGDGVVFDGKNGLQEAFRGRGFQHVSFIGLEIRNYSRGVTRLSAADHIIFRNCFIHHNGNHG